MKGIIEEKWKEFEKHSIPADAPDIQRRCMRMAFYIGASTIMEQIIHLNTEDRDAGCAMLTMLTQELADYLGDTIKEMDKI